MSTYNLVVSEFTSDGEGIAFYNDKKVFIKGAFVGETVEVELFGEKQHYAQGRLIKVIVPSSCRCEQFCDVNCGACSFTAMSYESELQFKEDFILKLFKNIPSFVPQMYGKIIPMEKPFNYRNKAVYACGESCGKAVLGLFEKNSHNIVPIHTCAVESNWMSKAKDIVQQSIVNISAWRYLFLRGSDDSEKIAVFVCWNEVEEAQEIAQKLSEIGINNVVLNVNNSSGNRILGDNFKQIIGSNQIQMEMLGLNFTVKPDSFFQINSIQTSKLYQLAVDMLNPSSNENVADLYCGIGTISIFLAQKVKNVYGIECVEAAIQDAMQNAENNKISNVHFTYGLVENELPKLVESNIQIDCAILDPSRKGCDSSVFRVLSECGANRVVYISCNPISQCRDIECAIQQGYQIERVESVDMFPHTAHVETVVLLSRDKA